MLFERDFITHKAKNHGMYSYFKGMQFKASFCYMFVYNNFK